VWWYEDAGETPRPHLVLTRNEGITHLHQLLAVPTTRKIRGIPSEVRLDRSDGMPTECVLTLDNATLVRKALLTRYVTTLGPARMAEVCEALNFATSC
jgi:mRNA-degrading endonuclease toxin of MazEF toxin-antitoxin module